MFKRFIISAVLLTAQAAYAESVVLEEIEVKSKKEARVESLEVNEVRESNAKDVCEAMQGMADVSQVRRGGVASDIVIRGYQKDNLNVMIDGARLHGGCPNRMDPPTFHLDFAEVDRIEIMKGAYDVTNPGSIGGLINIKTKRAKEGVHGELNGSVGSFDALSSSAYFSYGEEMFDIILGASNKSSKAFMDGHGTRFTEVYGTTAAARYRTNMVDASAYDINSAWGKVGINPKTGHRLELSVTRQEADNVFYPYLQMDGIRDNTNRFNATYEMKGISEILSELNFQYYYNSVAHDMTNEYRCSSSSNATTCADARPRGYSMRSYARTFTYGGKVEAMVNVFGGVKVGVDTYTRKWDLATTMFMSGMYMDQATIPDVSVQNVGTYLEYVDNISDSMKYTVGLRYDNTRQFAGTDRRSIYNMYYTSSSQAKTDSNVSGNLQLNYYFTPEIEGFFGFGHTVRSPDPVERFYALTSMGTTASPDWVGNTGLKAMKNNEFDLGVKGTFDTTLIKANVFYSAVQDYIELTNATSTGGRSGKSYANVNAALYGGEVSINAALPKDLFVAGSVAYTVGKDTTNHQNLMEIPPLKAVASLRYDDGELFGELTEIMAADQNRVNTSMGETKTAGWGITNVKAGYTYKGFKFIGGVDNLLNHYYSNYLSYQRDPFSAGVKVPEAGASYYFNLQYSF